MDLLAMHQTKLSGPTMRPHICMWLKNVPYVYLSVNVLHLLIENNFHTHGKATNSIPSKFTPSQQKKRLIKKFYGLEICVFMAPSRGATSGLSLSAVFTFFSQFCWSAHFVCTPHQLKNDSDDYEGLRIGYLAHSCGVTSGVLLLAVFTHF